MSSETECNAIIRNHPPVDESIVHVNQIFEKLLTDNDLDAAIKEVESFASKSLYHSIFKTTLLGITAFLTMDKNDIDNAIKSGEKTKILVNILRKESFMKNMSKLMQKTNYDEFTSLQLHAKITRAKLLTFVAIMTLIENQYSINFLRLGLAIHSCMSDYKKCKVIFEKRMKWESDLSRDSFEASVKLGNGCFNLILSQLPPKILRLLNLIGIRGDYDEGIKELTRASELNGIDSTLATFVLLSHHHSMRLFTGIRDYDTPVPEIMVNKALEKYPNNIALMLVKSKIVMFNGNFNDGIKTIESFLETDIPKGIKVIHFELMWIYAIKLEWDNAIKYASLLRQNALHSPAILTYFEAVYRYTKAMEEDDEQMKEEATKLFEMVTKIRIKSVPRLMTTEKISSLNSNKYLENQKFLCLPDIELLYQQNYISTIGKNPDILNKFLERVENKREIYRNNNINNGYNVICYGYSVFYCGVFLRLLGKYDDSIKCFTEVINNEVQYKKFLKDRSLVPQAVMELGLTYMGMKHYEKAKLYLDKVLKDYRGYMNERYIQFRIYSALKVIGINPSDTINMVAHDDDENGDNEDLG